ncbi:transmembrane 4 L6 family member 1-like [Podarcis raffonei]|uniref:transmembrane 4 L6 family member 1-like n=1 Tax=Podarcis raffonei TaxID=65483 RepID=UPI0023298670|nr:transmembrane 4 L6 family member 1-like [Podarcis raffonei]
MCYGRCIKYVGYKLLILAVLCIVANILLYFPNGEIGYASHNHLSRYVGCLHGIVGGGILVLIPAFVLIGLENEGCFHGCFPHEHYGRNCALLASVVVAAVGILGAGYCFIISALALAERPYCYCTDDHSGCYPFLNTHGGYLCHEPRHIVTWNVTLFAILLVLSGIEIIICTIHIIRGCLGGACAVCHVHKETLPKDANTKVGITTGDLAMGSFPHSDQCISSENES